MHEPPHIHTLDPARKYLRGLPGKEYAALLDEIQALGNGDPTVRTKRLRGPIRELILGHHRLTYFKIMAIRLTQNMAILPAQDTRGAAGRTSQYVGVSC